MRDILDLKWDGDIMPSRLAIGDAVLDTKAGTFTWGQATITLPLEEARIAELLMYHMGHPVPLPWLMKRLQLHHQVRTLFFDNIATRLKNKLDRLFNAKVMTEVEGRGWQLAFEGAPL